MDRWHTCNTTHCRAGWVIHLAGKAGYLLEKETSTAFAAMMIYKNSSLIVPMFNDFHVTDEEALKNIEECALWESVLGKQLEGEK